MKPIFKPQSYIAEESIRLVNPAQIAAYWVNGCVPKDLYVTRDYETNRPTIAAVRQAATAKPPSFLLAGQNIVCRLLHITYQRL